jgi:hypothetical protein
LASRLRSNLYAIMLRQQHPDQAELMYREVIDSGDPRAITQLGLMLLEHDPDHAEPVLRAADALCEAEATFRLSVLIHATDPSESVDLLLRAAELGHQEAQRINEPPAQQRHRMSVPAASPNPAWSGVWAGATGTPQCLLLCATCERLVRFAPDACRGRWVSRKPRVCPAWL